MSASPKMLLAAFVVCCVLAEAYGIKCFWTDNSGKDSKVDCTSDSKFCFKATLVSGDKKATVKGCAGETQHGAGNLPVDCTKVGDNGNGGSTLLQGVNCCSDKDYCNSAGRTGITLGLMTVVVASMLAGAVA